MVDNNAKSVECLVVDTTAFIQNAQLQNIAKEMYTVQSVVDEIQNKRQLRNLVVLPYDLQIKEVFPENIKQITEFSKKTGDYPSLSATDIQVMALTLQLEKEKVGTNHLRTEPIVQCVSSNIVTVKPPADMNPDITGFYTPDEDTQQNEEELITEKLEDLDILEKVTEPVNEPEEEGDEEDDEDGWITPSNVHHAKKQINSSTVESKPVRVACLTTDFAMQNVLKQMNLQVSALDGRIIKHLRTFVLRCFACFKTTSIMTKKFCPKCGNNTLKKVAVSLDENGQIQIHINPRKPLTGRGKKFSLPRIKGGKHPNNPILVEDQPMAQNHATKLARKKIDVLADDYICGYSPFAVRDVNSKSAQIGIRPGKELEMKHWMRKNPNEAVRGRKK